MKYLAVVLTFLLFAGGALANSEYDDFRTLRHDGRYACNTASQGYYNPYDSRTYHSLAQPRLSVDETLRLYTADRVVMKASPHLQATEICRISQAHTSVLVTGFEYAADGAWWEVPLDGELGYIKHDVAGEKLLYLLPCHIWDWGCRVVPSSLRLVTIVPQSVTNNPHLERACLEYDINSNGRVSIAEAESFGISFPVSRVSQPDLYAKLVGCDPRMDNNKDGVIGR